MKYQVHEEGGFRYIDEGQGENMLLLHGLFGALSNWDGVIDGFSDRFRVLIPVLPIYELPPGRRVWRRCSNSWKISWPSKTFAT